MTNKDFKFDVELGICEFHLIFEALQDQIIANIKAMKQLVRDEDVYEEVIEDQDKYSDLEDQNRNIQALMDKLYHITDEQLDIRN